MSLKPKYKYLSKTSVSTRGYVLYKNELKEEDLVKIKKDLTVAPKTTPGYGNGNPETFKLYKENDAKIYLPRHYGMKKIGTPHQNKQSKGLSINVPFDGQLRQYQIDILNSWDEHQKKYGGGIIAVGPGRGKTVMAIAKICEMSVKTMILVHTSDLFHQWIERLSQYASSSRIGKIQGKTLDIQDKDIVIVSIQSLGNPKKDKEYPDGLFKDFGMVVIDECHHMGAKMFSRCLRKTAFKYTMGLSATPDRTDGLTKVFKYYLGDICFQDAGIQMTVEEKELNHIPDADVRVYKYQCSDKKYSKIELNYQRKPNTVVMESNIANFSKRTDFIISLIPPLLAEGRKIIILTSRRANILEFLKKIEEREIGSCGPYVGGMKVSQLNESKTKQILIATYKMAEEGFDCQELDTLIMATPKRRIEQCSGRIMRKKKNDRINIPLVIDIADMFSNFKNWNEQRLKQYQKKNYRIAHYNVDNNGSTSIVTEETCHFKWKGNIEEKTNKRGACVEEIIEYDLT
jgi:superfamily II DNA or RNA helicase